MTTLIPTILINDVQLKSPGVEFTGAVEIFHTYDDYVTVRSFTGSFTKLISASPTPVQGRWEKGPIFNKLKRMTFSDKQFLVQAKAEVKMIQEFMRGEIQ
jgi:hypothetical protein